MDKRELKYRAEIGGWSAIVTFLSDDETSRIIEKDIIEGTKKGSELEFKIDRVPFESKLTKDKIVVIEGAAEAAGKNIPTPCAGAGATYGSYQLPQPVNIMPSKPKKCTCGYCGTDLIESSYMQITESAQSNLYCPKCNIWPRSINSIY